MSRSQSAHQAKYCPFTTPALALVWLVAGGMSALAQVEDTVSEIISDATEERIEQAMEDLLSDIESRIAEDSLRIQTDHWLVMAEAEVFDDLAQEGYLFDQISELTGLAFYWQKLPPPPVLIYPLRAREFMR